MVRMTVEDLVDDDGREAERRLVEEQQAGSRHERAPDGQHLLLAAREAAGPLAGPVGQAREQLVDPEQRAPLAGPAAPRRYAPSSRLSRTRQLGEDAPPFGDDGHAWRTRGAAAGCAHVPPSMTDAAR